MYNYTFLVNIYTGCFLSDLCRASCPAPRKYVNEAENTEPSKAEKPAQAGFFFQSPGESTFSAQTSCLLEKAACGS